MIKVSVIGSTGYAGSELVRILYGHPEVEIVSLSSHSYVGKKYNEVYGSYAHLDNLICEEDDLEKLSEISDVVFIALPHGIASNHVNEKILEKCKIIDLGADYRLKNIDTYEKWYGVAHGSKNLMAEAVYGLSELNREKIKKARLIANPGCYTTCSILCMYPLLKENIISPENIIIDAKSGVTGAGRGVSLDLHYNETNENIKAYKVASHRHVPEIEQELSEAAQSEVIINFTPHLIPMNRGILATCYGKLSGEYTYDDIKKVYTDFYGDEFFIRLMEKENYPQTKWVKGSNFCDIGFAVDERTNNVTVIGAIDNLMKGASGQAVQNMNIMFGLDEKAGLKLIPVFPA